jgi:hypothetical protein
VTDYRKLELKDEQIKTDYENIQEQRGGGAPLIPPGRYGFELPKNLAEAWDTFDTGVGDSQAKVQRVNVESDRDHPITLVKALRSTDEPLVGEVWTGRISNAERNRARKGDPANYVSDMTYLLRESFEDFGRYKTNREFINALNAHAGKRFAADNEWSANCASNRVRYIEVDGRPIEDPDKKFGCGNRIYQNNLVRDAEGYYQERQTCPKCGASIRCFQNLTRFGKLEG